MPVVRTSDLRRHPGDGAFPHLLIHHKTVQSVNFSPLRSFLREFSTLTNIQLCSKLYPCNSWLCPTCSRKRQRQFRKRLRGAYSAVQAPSALAVTLTLAIGPERPLRALWDDLDTLQRHLVAGSWLSRHGIVGSVRVTEIVRTPDGWLPHVHLLLTSQNELTTASADKLAHQLVRRWLSGARRRAIAADGHGQHVHRLSTRSDVHRWLGYLTKANTAAAPGIPGTLTPGDILSAAAHGDADALDLWHELETASAHRRMRSVAGLFRHRST